MINALICRAVSETAISTEGCRRPTLSLPDKRTHSIHLLESK